MWRMAMDSDGNGDVFPVFGICLGFETMHIMIANHTREELLVPSVGQESVANTIELTKDASDSLFFSYWKVRANGVIYLFQSVLDFSQLF